MKATGIYRRVELRSVGFAAQYYVAFCTGERWRSVMLMRYGGKSTITQDEEGQMVPWTS
jgi:hypothetical protein